ncbi:hypothetical protein BH09BAC1_BH09BAC1_19520 [soil metagenome]
MKNIFLFAFSLLLFSCGADNETATKAAETAAETPTLAALSAEERKRYVEEYGIDIEKGIPEGLKVGESAPIFKANDHKGNEVFLPDLFKKNPVVLVFYRGAWCPACNRYLTSLQDSLKYIENAGATLVAISPEINEKAIETVEKTKATFSVIPDPNGYIMSAFKLDFHVAQGYQQKINDKLGADIATSNGTQDARLPVPAVYIVGTDGKIKYAYFNPDYHQRATVAEIVAELNKLK